MVQSRVTSLSSCIRRMKLVSRLCQSFYIKTGLHFDYEHFIKFVKYFNLTYVPLLNDSFILPNTVDELVEFSKGKSVLNAETHREGIVMRPLINEYDNDLQGRLSFKCINPDFLLKYNE